MAKSAPSVDLLARGLAEDARRGVFKPVYLLMGEEPYYPDLVCDAILENCIEESERDFNQTVCYGSDVNADAVITAARRYPMFAERQLVVVREAQLMKDLENLSLYCDNPLDSTVLVICMHGAKADKRKALYKSVSKNGVVVESPLLRDYEVPGWISSYYSSRGLSIAPDAASLLAEHAGVDLAKISVETEKMLKNLPEGATCVSVEDIERNVGISRQYSIFELTKALSAHDAPLAMKMATNIGATPKFAMPMATAMLFSHFYKILKYSALMAAKPGMSSSEKAAALGVSPYFLRDYDMAARHYPLRKCMSIISMLKEYDYRGKGGDGEETSQKELLEELIIRILTA